ncbi:MAG: exonuclease SbcCD subunit D [Clostridia bacterium]
MRFLHLSDLHIGRRLSGISLLDDQRVILAQAAELVQSCDAVLLAGDLYDKAQPSAEAVKLVSDFLVTLSRLNKPVFAISGNHDSPEQIAYCHELLGACGVHTSPAFDGQASHHVLCDEHGQVHIWLLPFVKPASVRPFYEGVASYEEALSAIIAHMPLNLAQRNVLIAHQYVSGAETCDSESLMLGGVDCVSADLFNAFDYVALGHLHSPQRLRNGRVCYSGSPLKYSLSEERQKKAALIVTLGEKGSLSVEKHPFAAPHDLRTVRGELREIASMEHCSEDYVYAVLSDEGALIDPLGTLRLCYPNLIGMRIVNSRTNEEMSVTESGAVDAFSPMEHFAAFYAAQNNHQPPDERRVAAMRAIFEEAEALRNAAN